MSDHSSRRAFVGAGILAAMAAAPALAQQRHRSHPMQPANADHDMAGMDMHHMGGPDFVLTDAEQNAVRALSACDAAAGVCLSHCLQLMSSGDTSMAGCARTVRDVLSVCPTSQSLIESHSTLAGQQLVVCRAACQACLGECTPHAGHHKSCHDCAEACTAAIAAIDALLAT